MPTYIMHFACNPTRPSDEAERCIADLCVISPTVEDAEARARDLIVSHAYAAEQFIAYAELADEQIASLSEAEATLYLKAQSSEDKRAVMFSQWRNGDGAG